MIPRVALFIGLMASDYCLPLQSILIFLCPYDMQYFFSGQKSIIFRGKFLIFFLFLLKT